MFQNKTSPSITGNKLYKGIKGSELNLVINPKKILEFKEGDIVFQKGDKTDSLFLVIEGEAKLKIPGNKNALPLIDYKYKNDFFGEKELLEKTDRKSSAVANTNLFLYRLEAEEISSLISKNNILRKNLYQYKSTPVPPDIEADIMKPVEETDAEPPGYGDTEIPDEIDSQNNDDSENPSPGTDKPESTEDYFKVNFPEHDLQIHKEERTADEAVNLEDSGEEINAAGNDIVQEPPVQNNEEKIIPPDDDAIISWDFLETPPPAEDNKDAAFKFPDDENITEENETTEPPEVSETDEQTFNNPSLTEEHMMKINEEKNIEQKPQLNSEVFFRIIQSAEMIHAQDSLENVLNTIRIAAITITDSSEGRVFIQSKNNENDLWTYINDGVYSAEIEINIANTLAGKCFSENDILNISTLSDQPNYNVSFERTEDFFVDNMLCYPMTVKGGEVIGVIQLFNNAKGNFTESDEEILSLLSVSAANVILKFLSVSSEYMESGQLESLSIISRFLHEDLTRPLNSIKEYTALLKGKEQNAVYGPVLELISNQAQAGLQSVKTTLEFAEGKLNINLKEEISTETFNEILSLLAEFVEFKNVRLFKKIEDEARLKVDRAKLYQAFLQITKNACDAMPDGGNIYIVIKRAEEMLMVEIKDSGIGIPESIMPDIYEPFISHGKDNKTGLGLTIAKQIIEKHNGSISIESEIGKGTIVKVSLPIF
jgi:signal transduction histidine kinase